MLGTIAAVTAAGATAAATTATVGIVAALTLIRSDELEQVPEQLGLEPMLDLAA